MGSKERFFRGEILVWRRESSSFSVWHSKPSHPPFHLGIQSHHTLFFTWLSELSFQFGVQSHGFGSTFRVITLLAFHLAFRAIVRFRRSESLSLLSFGIQSHHYFQFGVQSRHHFSVWCSESSSLIQFGV